MGLKDKLRQISGSWYFLIAVVLAYGAFLIFDSAVFFTGLNFFNKIILRIIPVFLLVFVLMALSNYFITPKFVTRHLKRGGIKKWFFVILGGILSSGPVYMWYPLLADLRKKGLSYGFIACFLYNRAIKIPVLPIIIFYFGWKYVITLSFVMIFISIIQCQIMDWFMESKI